MVLKETVAYYINNNSNIVFRLFLEATKKLLIVSGLELFDTLITRNLTAMVLKFSLQKFKLS